MAAWLGLVPRQYSTGGKHTLLGISKRGDRYLRTLLIHGARAVIKLNNKKENSKNKWLTSLLERRGKNKACVAQPNKNARIIWSLMANGTEYRPNV